MSTLFENFYDSLGHEMHVGETVMAETCGYFIYGHIKEMKKNSKGEDCYVITPDIGWRSNKPVTLKRQYTVNWIHVFQITVTKKAAS